MSISEKELALYKEREAREARDASFGPKIELAIENWGEKMEKRRKEVYEFWDRKEEEMKGVYEHVENTRKRKAAGRGEPHDYGRPVDYYNLYGDAMHPDAWDAAEDVKRICGRPTLLTADEFKKRLTEEEDKLEGADLMLYDIDVAMRRALYQKQRHVDMDPSYRDLGKMLGFTVLSDGKWTL